MHRRFTGSGPRLSALGLITLGLFALAGGCAHGGYPEGPEGTIRAFAAALADQRYEEAYALMSEEYRQQVSLEEFRRVADEHPKEVLDAAVALGRGSLVREQALVRYGDAEEVVLLHEQEGWRLASNVADVYGQSTPRDALRTFLKAMEQRRYEVVLRLVPDAEKEGITPDRMREAWEGERREEIERLLSHLREHMHNPIEQVEDRATMAYGDHRSVQFVRERGAWKIETPE